MWGKDLAIRHFGATARPMQRDSANDQFAQIGPRKSTK